MYKELIVKEDPKSPISEIFRTLRTNIQFTNTKNKQKLKTTFDDLIKKGYHACGNCLKERRNDQVETN